MATQYLCPCGRLTSPADVAALVESHDTCPACGTDAPLLFADASGQPVSYSAPLSAEMQASQTDTFGISQ